MQISHSIAFYNLRYQILFFVLFITGANVNEYKGRKQFQELIKPEEEKYSIFQMVPTDYFQSIYDQYDRPKASFRTLVQLYLNAGMKLNTTPWVPCLFYGYVPV